MIYCRYHRKKHAPTVLFLPGVGISLATGAGTGSGTGSASGRISTAAGISSSDFSEEMMWTIIKLLILIYQKSMRTNSNISHLYKVEKQIRLEFRVFVSYNFLRKCAKYILGSIL